ncbi:MULTISPECIES: restriction endonuclease subunit S [Proteus]|uniref:EcoKI restriction-modification system protein HsdS n=1 Tax=Proteus mirabilis TaxID=584 RepID=A0A379GFF7_PROMI|nr:MULTISPECIES: restriction endonuclease subunit S [Proteus]MBI6493996.1 restriction endonuclease subunit S [Proteus mirabilis]EEI48325.1 type I restriction modification DNA specificity domain protein [Proteus mirabilis ATCC 29906]NBN36563.1 restriction endonuclease subunit S [Proteus sp. G4379]QER00212.1 restriction endonuclease subunit S [Proteus mirabilis]SUC39682.1 EcoKI restriction-modification system protein HsdS [Proteus mirabilis]
MGSKFETRLLGELCHEITVGFVGTMTNEYIENGIPFLRSKNIEEYDVKWDDMKYVSSAFHKKLSKSVLKPGDVAIVRTGKPGTTCVIPNDLREANCSDIVIARVNNELLCPHYLSYFMNAMAHGQVNAHIVGAVQQHFNVSSAKKLEIPLPSRVKQTKIVQVLKTLDDKLKLNRQINQTLEQMAQTLFKSWFVDFDPVVDNALDAGFFEQDLAFSDELLRRVEVRKAVRESDNFKPLSEDIRRLFPNAFEECAEPALGLGGWMPKGWMSKSISDAIFINPKVNLAKDTVAKFVDMKALSTSGYSIEEVSEKPFSGGMKFQNNDILLARITPCLENGKTGIVDFLSENEAGFGSTEFIILRGNKNIHYSYIACLARYESFRQHVIQSMVGSSGRQRVQNGCFNDYKIAVPSGEVMNRFADIVSPSFKKLTQNTNESRSLTKLRDTLLPKLISGELSLSDIKIDIPEETLI